MAETPARLLVGSRTVIEYGNSKAVTIPPGVLDSMDLEGGDDVELVFDREAEEVVLQAGAST